MKKTCLMLALLMTACCLFSCGEKTDVNEPSDDGAVTSKVNHNGGDDTEQGGVAKPNENENAGREKISGDIAAGSVFSEGKAFVSLAADNDTTYCINKDGYILFKLNEKMGAIGTIDCTFKNGLTLIQKYQEQHICDKNGKVTYPKDVGATKFYDIGFEGGYILAEVVESTFDSTVKKAGIMNTDFEWTVGPTEELYKYINKLNLVSYTKDRYFNDIVYIGKAKVYLDLKTGKIVSYEEIASKIPSNAGHLIPTAFINCTTKQCSI